MTSTPEQKRLQRLRQHYGVDQEWIEAQFKWQNGCCDGCRREFNDKNLPNYDPDTPDLRCVVDHKHNIKFKVVRSLLCDSCNGALGIIEKLRKDVTTYERLNLIVDRFKHYEKEYAK